MRRRPIVSYAQPQAFNAANPTRHARRALPARRRDPVLLIVETQRPERSARSWLCAAAGVGLMLAAPFATTLLDGVAAATVTYGALALGAPVAAFALAVYALLAGGRDETGGRDEKRRPLASDA